jgi:hypothetical protein
MSRYLLCFVFCLSTCFVKAQTIIEGLVQQKADGKVLPGVNVMVKEKNAAGMLSYALTDDKGRYKLSFKSLVDSVLITVSGFNLKKQVELVANKSQALNFSISAAAIQLKEIKVNPPKIRKLNDTLNYLMDGYTDQNDRTIGDVLKKMPGISVKDNGEILYNNKPINKFYIEEKDLLQGRYGIATNNIQAKDVATVQVLENHQPIKALKNREFTDEGAINLKLKDSAKGVLSANAQIGAGLSPLLWNNELFSMFFNKDRQNMNTYKGNNTGNDATAELNSLYGAQKNSKLGTSLSVQSPGAPGISQQRYLFNRANAASVNHLWAYQKDHQLTANISYLNDRQERNSYSRSVYYLPADSLLTVEEHLAVTEHLNVLDGSLQFNVNQDKYYLDNTLKFNGTWNELKGGVFSDKEIIQDLNKPFFNIGNVFNLIKNNDKRGFNIYSVNQYKNSPQILGIRPLLYTDLFDEARNYNAMQQSLKQQQFSSVSRMVYGLDNGAWKQSYKVGLEVNAQHMESELRGQSSTESLSPAVDTLSNNLNWNKYTLQLASTYTYKRDQLNATLSLPLENVYLYTNKERSGLSKNTNKLFFNPSFNIKYDLNLFWNVSASANYNQELGGMENSFTGYVLQSYRSILRNEGPLPEQKRQSYALNLGYRHPVHAVFLNVSGSYFRQKMNVLYGYDYQGIRSVKKTYERPNFSDGYRLFSRLSKGIDAIATTLNLELDYSRSRAAQLSQDKVIDFTNIQYRLLSGFYTKINKWASLAYDYEYGRNSSKLVQGEAFKPISTSIQRGRLNLFPARGFTLNMALENFYNSAILSGSRRINFADITAKYNYKRLEYSIACNNVFNEKQYVAASYNEISTYYAVYDLRPAQLLLKVRFKLK